MKYTSMIKCYIYAALVTAFANSEDFDFNARMTFDVDDFDEQGGRFLYRHQLLYIILIDILYRHIDYKFDYKWVIKYM